MINKNTNKNIKKIKLQNKKNTQKKYNLIIKLLK